MQFKTLAKIIAVVSACTIGSGVLSGFPASADITDIIQLTVEQTRALYGDSISAQYYTQNNTWADCTFEYLGSSYGMLNSNNNLSSGGYVQSDQNILFNSDWLYYGLAYDDISLDMVVHPDQFQFRLVPSVNVQGIAYFRQIVASSRYTNYGSGFDPWRSAYYTACGVSFSASRQVFYGAGTSTSTDSPANIYFTPAPLAITNFVISQSNPFAFCDIYLQNIDSTGQEQTFALNEFIFRPSRVNYVQLSFYDGEGLEWITKDYYLIAISCPRLTDGYVMPDVPTLPPDYSGQLDDIISQGNAGNTLLQQILAKLDLIYQKMQQQTGYNPALTPASTIPRDLQQYYSGIASGAPSASAINDYTGGASIIPFSSILSASGLGGLFGLLAGIACAGWVLTKGRGG